MKSKISIEEYRRLELAQNSKRNKYGVADKSNRTWTGFFRGREQTIIFDSAKEMNRFCELLWYGSNLMDLQLQERFLIGTDPITYYVTDFYYLDALRQSWIAEEVKGFWTRDAKKKVKLFREKYPDIILDII